MLTLLLAILLVGDPTAPAAPITTWPQFRGPNRDGISPQVGINKDWGSKPPRLLWKTALGDDGYAGPAVSGGIVYIVDHSGAQDILRALRADNGAETWHFAYDDTDRPSYGFARATPTVVGRRIYTMSRQGILNCVDAGSGALVWRRDTIKEFQGRKPMWDVAASPLVDGKQLIVLPGGPNAAIAALDPATGKTLWQGGGSDKPAYATPTIAVLGGKRQYLTFSESEAVGYDTAGGNKLWSFPWAPRDGTSVASPIAVGDRVFISASYGMGSRMLQVTGSIATELWSSQSLACHFNTPVLYQGYLYGVGEPGRLTCMDPNTGKVMWEQPGFEKGGVVAVDGKLIAMNGSNGDVVMADLDPTAYRERGRINPLGGQSWSPPVVAQDRLFIRNKKALACIDLR